MHAVVHRRGVAAGVGFPRLAAPDVQERVGSVRLAGFSGHDCHNGGHDVVAHTGLFYRPGIPSEEEDAQLGTLHISCS